MAKEDFNKLKKEIIDIIAELRVLKEEAEKVGDALGKDIKLSNPKTTKQLNDQLEKIKDLEEALKQKTKAEEEEGKQQKKLIKVKQDLINSQTEENKQLLEYREELKEVNKNIKAQIVIEKELGIQYKNSADLVKKLNQEQIKQVSTIEEAQKQNKALRGIVRQLNADIPEQAAAIKTLNDSINSNTDFISDNSDEFIQNKINIGNYTDSITDAIGASDLFGESNAILASGLGALSPILSGISERFDSFLDKQRQSIKENKKLSKALRRLKGPAAIVAVGLLAIGAAIGASQEKTLQLEIFIGKLKNTLLTLVSVGAQVGNGLLQGLKLASGSVTNLLDNINIGSLKASKAIADFLGIDKSSNKLAGEIEELEKGLVDLDALNPLETITGAFDGFAERIEYANDELEKQLRLQFDLENQLRISEVAMAELGKQQERLTNLAEDDTISLKAQIKFSKLAEDVARDRGNLEVDLAKKRQRIAEQAVKVELARAKLDTDLSTGIIKNAAARDKASKAALDALKEANIAVIEAEINKNNVLFKIQESRRKAERDVFEQALDFQIDVTERNRNLLIQQFEDTQKSVDGRLASFGKLKTQLSKDLDDQVQIFDDFAKKTADSLSGLADELDDPDLAEKYQEQADLLNNIDFDIDVDNGDIKLFNNGVELSLDNIVELNKELKALGFSEIPVNRLKEVITDGKDAAKEIVVLGKEFERLKEITEKESTDALILSADELKRTKELNKELDDLVGKSAKLSNEDFNTQLDAILEKQKELSEDIATKRIDDRIELIDKEIKLVQKGSIDEIDLQKEKNELLTELEEQKLKDTEKRAKEDLKIKQDKAKEEEEIEKAKDQALDRLRDKVFDALIDRQNKISDERQKDLQDNLDGSNEIESLRESAAQEGNTIAGRAAAEEREIQRELTEDLRKEKQKQIRNELILTGLKTFSAKAGQPNAGIETVAELVGLISILSATPSFAVGSDFIDTSGHNTDGKGGMTATIHHGERILTEDQNKRTGGRTNNEVVDLISQYDKGELTSPASMFNSSEIITSKVIDNSSILEDIKNEISAIEIPERSLSVNQVKSIIEEVVDRKGTKEIRVTRI